MRVIRATVTCLAFMGFVCLCNEADAQFRAITFEQRAVGADSKPLPVSMQPARTYAGIGFYPVALFQRAGLFPGGTAGTSSAYGTMLSADVGVRPAKSALSLEVGGWYWTGRKSDLYEFHGRVLGDGGMGLQLGYIQSTRASVDTLTAFWLLNLNSDSVRAQTRRRWNIELGLGMDFDRSGGKSTREFTMFVQGGVEIAKNLSLTGTHWYIRNRQTDLSRLTLGLNYHF